MQTHVDTLSEGMSKCIPCLEYFKLPNQAPKGTLSKAAELNKINSVLVMFLNTEKEMANHLFKSSQSIEEIKKAFNRAEKAATRLSLCRLFIKIANTTNLSMDPQTPVDIITELKEIIEEMQLSSDFKPMALKIADVILTGKPKTVSWFKDSITYNLTYVTMCMLAQTLFQEARETK